MHTHKVRLSSYENTLQSSNCLIVNHRFAWSLNILLLAFCCIKKLSYFLQHTHARSLVATVWFVLVSSYRWRRISVSHFQFHILSARFWNICHWMWMPNAAGSCFVANCNHGNAFTGGSGGCCGCGVFGALWLAGTAVAMGDDGECRLWSSDTPSVSTLR